MSSQFQLLVDWINSIKEPHCLLFNDKTDLIDGKVVLELLKKYIEKRCVYEEELFNEMVKKVNSYVFEKANNNSNVSIDKVKFINLLLQSLNLKNEITSKDMGNNNKLVDKYIVIINELKSNFKLKEKIVLKLPSFKANYSNESRNKSNSPLITKTTMNLTINSRKTKDDYKTLENYDNKELRKYQYNLRVNIGNIKNVYDNDLKTNILLFNKSTNFLVNIENSIYNKEYNTYTTKSTVERRRNTSIKKSISKTKINSNDYPKNKLESLANIENKYITYNKIPNKTNTFLKEITNDMRKLGIKDHITNDPELVTYFSSGVLLSEIINSFECVSI